MKTNLNSELTNDFFDSYIGNVQRELPRSSTKPKLGSTSKLKDRFYSIKNSRLENRCVQKNYNSVENSHRNTPMNIDQQATRTNQPSLRGQNPATR